MHPGSCGPTQEGLPYLLPFITRQRLALDLPEFLALLQDRSLILPNSRKRATILAGEEGAPEAAAAAEAGGQEAQEQQEEAAAAAAGQQEGGAEGEGQEGDQQQQQPGSKKRPLSSARRMMVTDPGVLADIARLKPGCVVVELSASAMQQLGLGAGESFRPQACMAGMQNHVCTCWLCRWSSSATRALLLMLWPLCRQHRWRGLSAHGAECMEGQSNHCNHGRESGDHADG
jgi:hypothetical protein